MQKKFYAEKTAKSKLAFIPPDSGEINIGCVGGNRITNVGKFVVWRESFQYNGLI